MGIPRLISHLEPYAVSTVLGCKTAKCNEHQRLERAIIDGPSLVYHVYHRILAHKSPSKNHIDAVPSYEELGKAILVFLDELENHGLAIHRIYFDGFLPLDKKETRQLRLDASLKRLWTFHESNSNMSNKANHEYSSSSVTVAQIFNAMHPTPHSLRWLPTPAFMVPAALDVLSASKYATIMSVVPAEADLFCARAAAEAGGTILTSDSDLLVYELGKEGAVAFFNQIELHPPLNGFQNCQIMRARKSQPAEIANRLGVTDFRRLAYQIKKNPSNSLLQNVNSAKTSEHQHVKSSSKKKTEEDELEFNRFCKSYDIDTAPFQSPSRNPIISLEGQHFLGPRVSELALGPSSSSSSSEVPTIYLPFLLEDPSRASAWRVSRGLRTLAYTYLLSNPLPNLLSSPLHQLPSQKMLEVSRRGYRITADEISLLSGNALTAQTQTLERKIIKFQTSFSDIPVPLLWNLYALSETLEWNHTTYHRHPLPLSSSSFSSSSLNTISHLLSGTDPTTANLSWPTIHISAQTQAVLYSLRIIAQALQHHSCSCPATNLEQARLSQRLSTLPPLAHLLPSPSTMIALVANHSSILPRFIAFMDETLNS